MSCSLQMLPIRHHDLAYTLQSMTLDISIVVGQEIHNSLLTAHLAHHHATIGVKTNKLTDVVQCNGHLSLCKTYVLVKHIEEIAESEGDLQGRRR